MDREVARARMDEMKETTVLVIGDLILDEYVSGTARRISPEAPVPVVEFGERHYVPGGAANVATNICALGASTLLTGIIGDDPEGRCLQELLGAVPRLKVDVLVAADRPTTTKTRVVAGGQQLLRIDRERRVPIAASLARPLVTAAVERLRIANSCVLSDYGKGVLGPATVRGLVHACSQASIPSVVDPKTDDLARFSGATIVTPNLDEARRAAQAAEDEPVESLGARLLESLDNAALLITRGPDGMSLFRRDCGPVHVRAQRRLVFDRTGAGDTVVAMLSAALAVGMALDDAVELASRAAGVVVGKPGVGTVTPDEILATFDMHVSEAE